MYWYLLFLLFCCRNVYSNSSCELAIAESYLELASELMQKTTLNRPIRYGISGSRQPVDCIDVLHMGHNTSGIYTVYPISRITNGKPLEVYCDMDTDGGGWTVIQRRGNFGRPQDFFFKDWKSYKEGFGDKNEDFWLGNDNIFALTNQRLYSARFDLQDVEFQRRFALYDTFWINDEHGNYTLHINGYRGDAGDSMKTHNSIPFSTKDRDNDETAINCAEISGGGWWYTDCHYANLNGLYGRGRETNSSASSMWVSWYHWKGHSESLESTEMKIRPKRRPKTNTLSVTFKR